MRLRHVAVCGAVAAVLGVACGGTTIDVGVPGEAVQVEGGATDSSAAAPAVAGSRDAGATFTWPRADLTLYDDERQ